MRVIKEEPDKSVVKTIVCRSCGVTIEYVPNDVRTFSSDMDLGGSEGFHCPKCHKAVVTRGW